MRLSTILLFASWIPLIQLFLFYICESRNSFTFFLISFSLPMIVAGFLIKEFRKKIDLYKSTILFISVFLFTVLTWGIPILFSEILWDSNLFQYPMKIFSVYSILLVIIILLNVQLLQKFRGRNKINRFFTTFVLPVILTIIYFGVLTLLANFIHLPGSQDKLITFYLVSLLLLFIISFMLWLFFGFHKKVNFYKAIGSIISTFLLFTAIFGIPFLSILSESYGGRLDTFKLGIHFGIVSSLISCVALFLAWKEARQTEKPNIPILKFILASISAIWQSTFAHHLYFFENDLIRLSIGPLEFSRFQHMANPKLILFLTIGTIIVNVLFFWDILFKRMFKERQILFLPVTGLAIVCGTYFLVPIMAKVVYILPFYGGLPFILNMSFIIVNKAILFIAVIFICFGGGFLLFKKRVARAAQRAIGVIISIVSITLYLFLFKSFWPIRDPGINVLIRTMKSFEGERLIDRDSLIDPFYYEFFMYGEIVLKPLLDTLKHDDKLGRYVGINALRRLKDHRVVEPFISLLKDKKEWIRAKAATALGFSEDQRAIEQLISALKSEKSPVVRDVIYALSNFKNSRVIEALLERLRQEESDGVKSEINNSLHRITGMDYWGQLEKMSELWQEWWDKNKEDFIKKKEKK